MNGPGVNDLVRGGYDPLQHHDPQAQVAERYVRFGLRVDTPGRDQFGRWNVVPGTVGDLLGGFLWPFATQPDPIAPAPTQLPIRDLPRWGFAFPAIVVRTFQGAGGATPTGVGGARLATADTQAAVLPLASDRKDPAFFPVVGQGGLSTHLTPDLRHKPINADVGWQLQFRSKGILLSGTSENGQEAVFVQGNEPHVAVNGPPPPAASTGTGSPDFATLVYDLTAGNEPDPQRFARLHSLVRVVRPKSAVKGAEATNFDSANSITGRSGCLATNYATGFVDDLPGHGMVSGWAKRSNSPFDTTPGVDPFASLAGKAAPPPPTAAGQAALEAEARKLGLRPAAAGFGVWTTGIFLTADQAPRVADVLRAAGCGGVRVIQGSYGLFVNSFTVSCDLLPSQVRAGAGAGAATTQAAPTVPNDEQNQVVAIGCMQAGGTRGTFGPIDPGGPGCCHQLGKTWDGETIYSAHIDTEAYFRSTQFDAPLTFEGRLPQKPKPAPLLVPAHIYWDPDDRHGHSTGPKPGRWKVYAEAFDYATRTPTGSAAAGGGGAGDAVPVCAPATTAVKSWRATPHSIVAPEVLLRSQAYVEGVADTRSVFPLSDQNLSDLDDSPVVGRLTAWGSYVGGSWKRDRERGASEFSGGVASGGAYFSAPDQDAKNEVLGAPYLVPQTSKTYFIFDPAVKVGFGKPKQDGTVVNFVQFMTSAGVVTPTKVDFNGALQTFPANYLEGPTGDTFRICAGIPPQVAGPTGGNAIRLTGADGVAGSSVAGAADGGAVSLFTGNAQRLTSGDAQGGDVRFSTGAGIGVGRKGAVIPTDDNATSCGLATNRWSNVFSKVVTTGDLGFTDEACPGCGGPFEVDDEVVWRVVGRHADGDLDVKRSVPVHVGCGRRG